MFSKPMTVDEYIEALAGATVDDSSRGYGRGAEHLLG
jgi:hypothetical protein